MIFKVTLKNVDEQATIFIELARKSAFIIVDDNTLKYFNQLNLPIINNRYKMQCYRYSENANTKNGLLIKKIYQTLNEEIDEFLGWDHNIIEIEFYSIGFLP